MTTHYHAPIQIQTASGSSAGTSILVIYTGGTIGMDYDPTGSFLIPFDFEQILKKLPELLRFDLNLTVLSFLEPIDSSDMTPQHWLSLAKVIGDFYDDYDGFVILHGTDTMAYSASALSFLLENLAKPVIFTGSQLPIARPRTDARENFISALEIAATQEDGKPLIPEVCIFFDNLLLRANRTRKVQSHIFTAFKSGNYPPLAITGVTIDYQTHVILPIPQKSLIVHQTLNEDIFTVRLFPGMNLNYLASIIEMPRLQGIVLESYGSGNVPTDDQFLDILQYAIEKDIIIYNVSQCNGGAVQQDLYGAGQRLNEIGVIEGADSTPEAALTKLMFITALETDLDKRKNLLYKSLRGEMTSK